MRELVTFLHLVSVPEEFLSQMETRHRQLVADYATDAKRSAEALAERAGRAAAVFRAAGAPLQRGTFNQWGTNWQAGQARSARLIAGMSGDLAIAAEAIRDIGIFEAGQIVIQMPSSAPAFWDLASTVATASDAGRAHLNACLRNWVLQAAIEQCATPSARNAVQATALVTDVIGGEHQLLLRQALNWPLWQIAVHLNGQAQEPAAYRVFGHMTGDVRKRAQDRLQFVTQVLTGDDGRRTNRLNQLTAHADFPHRVDLMNAGAQVADAVFYAMDGIEGREQRQWAGLAAARKEGLPKAEARDLITAIEGAAEKMPTEVKSEFGL